MHLRRELSGASFWNVFSALLAASMQKCEAETHHGRASRSTGAYHPALSILETATPSEENKLTRHPLFGSKHLVAQARQSSEHDVSMLRRRGWLGESVKLLSMSSLKTVR